MTFLADPIWFKIFGVAGVSFAALGAVFAVAFYRGKKGERYSPFNHFISELGELGVSKFALVFNLSLILSGLALIPASLSLGMMLPGLLAKLGMLEGVICAVSLALVGVFPMNEIKPHGKAAISYLRTGLAMVILFSLAIAFQGGDGVALSRWYALAGLPPVLAFASFLFLIGQKYKEDQEEDPLATDGVQRPKFWHLAVVEWSIFLAVLPWFLLISLGLR